MNKLFQYLRRLQAFADRPWYLVFVSALGGLDLFVFVIPTDGLLISYVLLRPKHWVKAFISFSIGCAVGSLVLAGLVQGGGEWFSHQAVSQYVGRETWNWVDKFVEGKGALSLAILALLPLPQFPGVAVAALMGMPLLTVFLSVLVGRLIKFSLLSYGASHAPKLLMKLPFVKKEMGAVTGAPPRS